MDGWKIFADLEVWNNAHICRVHSRTETMPYSGGEEQYPLDQKNDIPSTRASGMSYRFTDKSRTRLIPTLENKAK